MDALASLPLDSCPAQHEVASIDTGRRYKTRAILCEKLRRLRGNLTSAGQPCTDVATLGRTIRAALIYRLSLRRRIAHCHCTHEYCHHTPPDKYVTDVHTWLMHVAEPQEHG